MSETKCDDCGLPISVCNARAMLQFAIGRNGVEAVSAAIADLTTLSALQEQNRALREALEVYAEPCDATEATPCGYEGNMCCKAARKALASTKQEGGE